MSIETTITHAWQTQAKWLYLLMPLSWLYAGISATRRWLYKQNILSSYRADVPVMVIGNITVGGSGKTPLIISLVKHLQHQGVEVGVISRGYGGDRTQMPALVTPDSTPDVVGDEPCLIVQSTNVPMCVCPNRQQAIEQLLNHNSNIQLIISDDGLQHYKLQRDIEWIVVDSHRGFGNQQILPVGFLREPMSRLDGATVVYHQTLDTSQNQQASVLTMQLQPSELEPLLKDRSILKSTSNQPQAGEKVVAMSGIGYPVRFFNTLRALGFLLEEKPFPDHHDFTVDDLHQFTDNNKSIIVTSKDAVKLRQLAQQSLSTSTDHCPTSTLAQVFSRIWVLPVTAELSAGCLLALDNRLKQFNIAYSPNKPQ